MRAGLARIVVPALRTLRAHRATALLLVGAGAAALAALLPVSSLVAPPGARLVPRLGLPPARGSDIALVLGTMARGPAATREAALLSLFRLLLGVAGGVLVVGWLTTLALAAARAAGRRTEIVVRRAVGASRRNLLASELVEGGTLAAGALLVGGILGLAFARLAAAEWPFSLGAAAAGPSVAAAAAAVGAVLLGALLPLLFARRGAPLADAGPATLGLVLPAAQLGLSLTVLAAAALLNCAAEPVPRQGHAAGGEVYQIGAPAAQRAARAAGYRALLLRLRSDRAVAVASLSSPGAITGLGPIDNASTDCGDCVWGQLALPWHQVRATHYLVSADTFRTLGIPVIAGRAFTDDDRWDTARVAVVNRTLAAWHFQHGDAVGRLIRVGHGSEALYTVVGVVEDRRPMAFGAGLEPPYSIYLSVLQHPAPQVDLLVRGAGERPPLATVDQALRRALGAAAVTAGPVSESRLLAAEVEPVRWFATMLGSEGWVMLAVATGGAFAMMWLWVASLAPELGVRRSVGARRRDVVCYVLSRAAVVAAGGVAFGCWAGMMAWDALRSVVAGLPAWDFHAVLRVAALLALAACAGALLPAWRAARASPAALLAI